MWINIFQWKCYFLSATSLISSTSSSSRKMKLSYQWVVLMNGDSSMVLLNGNLSGRLISQLLLTNLAKVVTMEFQVISQLPQLKETSPSHILCHAPCVLTALRIHTVLRFLLRIKQMENYLAPYCSSTKSLSGVMFLMLCISILLLVQNQLVSTITLKLPSSINIISKQKWHISSQVEFSIQEVFHLQTTHH